MEHFDTEDHLRCEHQFARWVDQNHGATLSAAMIGQAEPGVLEQYEALYGRAYIQHKPDKNDNVDGSRKANGPAKEGNNDRAQYDDLFRVPWQSRPSLTSDSIEPESPSLESPDDIESPFEEEDNESLESLPFIVLQHVGRYLDGKSLGNLALTSKYLRWVCASLLQEKGMVEMKWEKRDDSWQITKRVRTTI